MNPEVKYQEATHWFIHLSTLRRTTMGFLFAATAASLGIVYSKGSPAFETALLFAIGNIMFCVAVLLQEVRLHEIQRRLATYAREQEDGNGPFVATQPPHKGVRTYLVFMTLCCLFIVFWVIQPIAIKMSNGLTNSPTKASSVRGDPRR